MEKFTMKKILILVISLVFISTLGSSAFAESVTDSTGDVYHWKNTGTTWGWDTNIDDKPNIDITDISYSIIGEQIVVTMTVAGAITDSEVISYWGYLNTSDSTYMFSWNNGEAFGFGTNIEPGSYEMDYDPEITASGNTISATFDVIGTFQTDIEVWGWAAEYTTYGDTAAEWWADWAPEEYSWYEGNDSEDTSEDDSEDDSGEDTSSTETGETDNGDKNTNGTPGFEIFALLTALIAIVFIIKRRN
jgi:uncharacterized protein YxeA